MELKGDLQTLIDKAWDLQVGINEEINKSSFSLCRLCSENGHFCGIVETPFQNRERLIVIRDSLKQLQDMLLLLQDYCVAFFKLVANEIRKDANNGEELYVYPKPGTCTLDLMARVRLRFWHPLERYEALTRLEESRLSLIKQVSQYEGIPLDVVREINACFNNGKTVFDWKFSTQEIKLQGVNSNVNQLRKRSGVIGFCNCFLRTLFNPLRCHNAFGVAAKLVIVFASVSSMSKIYNVNKKCLSSQKKSSKYPQRNLPPSTQDLVLNVFYGRG